ncbi:sulfotransferase family 2 domain-containing protein [Shimia abyssi]|uniref:Sulfotransferase family protein n=1 Tax=Shimia abyssi TaxID=1662395 RepID=A0A2P8FCA2_9RHOB|nr:sulfotransferase family 2 domain-containing protein [Shimia abyssi]PSL19333.1 sulfotransferase family protein [Shimia abyssi]
MIISEEYGFIFVHIPKTAGLSVTDAFGKYGRPKNRSVLRSLSRRLPFREKPAQAHFREHETASKMIAKLGRPVFDSFCSFSVVRNPFLHAVSHYEYMKQFRIASTAKKVGQMSFVEYLENRTKQPFWNQTIFSRLPDQTYFLTDDTGAVAVDHLIKFESLNSELEQLSQSLKLPEFKLQHVNKTKSQKKSLDSYYDEQAYNLVRQIYRRDFDLIGYSENLPESL